jgi:hypothetical protein
VSSLRTFETQPSRIGQSEENGPKAIPVNLHNIGETGHCKASVLSARLEGKSIKFGLGVTLVMRAKGFLPPFESFQNFGYNL